jgi:hypothetical protein
MVILICPLLMAFSAIHSRLVVMVHGAQSLGLAMVDAGEAPA